MSGNIGAITVKNHNGKYSKIKKVDHSEKLESILPELNDANISLMQLYKFFS